MVTNFGFNSFNRQSSSPSVLRDFCFHSCALGCFSGGWYCTMSSYQRQLGYFHRYTQEMHQHTCVLLLCVFFNWRYNRRVIKLLTSNPVMAGVNILLDIWILVMPMRTLTRIKRPRRDKVILAAIFGVGGLSCIAGSVFEHFKTPQVTTNMFTASFDFTPSESSLNQKIHSTTEVPSICGQWWK
jgi:hypothetical protein